jgi:hypothetical protein
MLRCADRLAWKSAQLRRSSKRVSPRMRTLRAVTTSQLANDQLVRLMPITYSRVADGVTEIHVELSCLHADTAQAMTESVLTISITSTTHEANVLLSSVADIVPARGTSQTASSPVSKALTEVLKIQ